MAPETEHTSTRWHIDFDKNPKFMKSTTNLVELDLQESIECINVDIGQTFNMIIHSKPACLTCCDNY